MKRVLWVVWPAFLMAGLIEALVFAFVDPTELPFVAGMHLSRNAIYSISFLAIWGAVCLSSALTLLLASPPQPLEDSDGARLGGGVNHHAA